MNMSKNLKTLSKYTKKQYTKKSHDWNHVLRVKENATLIAEAEGADKRIVIPATILHDLGRNETRKKPHSSNTKLAQKLLQKASYHKEKQYLILSCIKTHSTESKNKPSSLEAKILFDADKIDSYGFTGVARYFIMAGEQGWSLQEVLEKALHRMLTLEKVGGFYTKTGKKIGFKKAKRAFIFYYLLAQELKQEKKLKEMEKILEKNQGKIKAKILKKILEKI